MISKAELKELEALNRTLCKVCGPKLKGWIEERREKATAKKRGTVAVADGPLDKAVFVRALTACSKVAARVNSDAGGLVRIEQGGGKLILYATDGELFVTRTFKHPFVGGSQADLYDAQMILRWLKSRKGKWADACLRDDGLVLRVGTDTVRLKPRVFASGVVLPKPPGGKARKLATIFSSDLRRLFIRTMFAATEETRRYAFNSVCLEARKDGMTAVATDQRCLAWAGFVGDVVSKGQFLVPLFAVGIINGLLRDIDEVVEIHAIKWRGGEDVFTLSSPSLDIQCRQVEGTFPDYGEYLHIDCDAAVEVDRADLLAVVKDVAPFCISTNDQRGTFRLTAAKGGLVLRSYAKEHRGQRFKVAGEFRGGRHSAAYLDPFFMADMLKELDDERVTVEMRGFETGIFVKADCFRYVLASVATSETKARRERNVPLKAEEVVTEKWQGSPAQVKVEPDDDAE